MVSRTPNPSGILLPASLRLAPGEVAQIELPGLGTAGYRWEANVQGEGVELAWRHKDSPSTRPQPVGASRAEVLRVTATDPGRATVHLAQRRPWETDAPPRAVHEVEVVVHEAP